MKVTSNDALAILRRFDLAGDDHVPRHIEQLAFYHPIPTSTMVTFRFMKRKYYILFDDTVEDNTQAVVDQVRTVKQDETGEVIQNPNDHLMTYGLPFKGKDTYLFVAISDKKRLDIELAERYPDTSRSTWQKHVRAGHIKVNGGVQESPKFEVTENDVIAIDLPRQTDFSHHELPIIYLDDNVIVIDKPVGVLTHSKGALNDEFTVAEFFRRYTTVGLETNRPGIVHRLDRDTSGVMIGARNEETAVMLQKQFADRKTKKEYMAVVTGHPKQDEALVDLPIGRNPTAPSTFRVDAGGKSAQTTYKVVESSDSYALVKLRPRTGRTHQLRVHMQYLGTPIVGDRVYGGVPADRLYLHAQSLEVTIPGGDRRTFVSDMPQEFLDKVHQV
ncbi:MAG TPA: RluA family pseudouridine synthase [Candidatus Saccharibacteria bacterium]|nr:RluA family pseudouridine synthase [Candidatus Saccharibacteria bacterium]